MNNRLHIQAYQLHKQAMMISKKPEVYFVIFRFSGNLKVELFRSEVGRSHTGVCRWQPFTVPLHDILHEETLLFECYYVSALTAADKLIGSFEVSGDASITLSDHSERTTLYKQRIRAHQQRSPKEEKEKLPQFGHNGR